MRTRTALAAGAAAVLIALGSVVTVAAAGGRESAAAPAVPAADSADAGFARYMAVHHQQAVEMSFLVRDSTDDEEIRTLAYDIANTQANQRGMMLGWLDLWGLPKVSSDGPMAWMGMRSEPGKDGALMPGMATKAELDRLRKTEGEAAEILYLRLMTAHHKGGIHMAEGCVSACEVEAEHRLAKGMVEAQQSEIDLMAELLRKRGVRE
ncbi:DUF305 domain-containing protein [Streptomyces sp. NPDC058374]|uniref:DUF305 domain-containing protein n=1 Tax=Streptomyces sp. NPDC058374 TaxID=3346466 RepID=UPI00365A17F2